MEKKVTIRNKVERLKQISTKKLYNDLQHRFQSLSTPLFSSLSSMDAGSPDTILDFDTMMPILQQYHGRVEVNQTLLESECKRAKIQCKTGGTIVPERYPIIQTVMKIHNTLPVSTATVERGFSTMNRIISYARNSLTTHLASDLI